MTPIPWHGILAVEGVETGDSRKWAPGAFAWDPALFPLPLRWCPVDTGEGHDDAMHVGWIDTIERQGSNILGSGTLFDEDFATWMQQVGTQGVSVDPDSTHFDIVGADGQPLAELLTETGLVPDDVVQLFNAGRIRAVTAVTIPAFVEAKIQLTEGSALPALQSGPPVESLVAATAPSEPTPPPVEPLECPAAGLALQAQDTGRWLVQQRGLGGDDPEDAGGQWEFPGGKVEPGEQPQDAAMREFSEETGCPLPDNMEPPTLAHTAANGYQLFAATIPREADMPINGITDYRHRANPDSEENMDQASDGTAVHKPEVAAYMPIDHLHGWSGTRQELRDSGALGMLGNNPPILASSDPNVPSKMTVTVVGPNDQLAAFANVCQTVGMLSDVGSSRTVSFDVDGDGAAALKFSFDQPVPDADPSITDSGDEIHLPGIAASAGGTMTTPTAPAPVQPGPHIPAAKPDAAKPDAETPGVPVAIGDNVEVSGIGHVVQVSRELVTVEVRVSQVKKGTTPPPAAPVGPGHALVAAATDGGLPPEEWFGPKQLDGPTPLTITEDGEVYGHLALNTTCHADFAQCTTPPSEESFDFFHLGSVLVASSDGIQKQVPVGRLTVGGGHADVRMGLRASIDHYDDATTTAAAVAAHNDEWGIQLHGSLVSSASPQDIELLRLCPPSGDWRKVNGKYRLICAHAVNVPGYPVPRTGLVASSGSDDSLILTFGITPHKSNLRAVADRIARSAGRDPETRREQLTLRRQAVDAVS